MRFVRLSEHVVEGKPLGRHVLHDPRSRRYPVAAVDPAALQSVRHFRYIPVLDQGSLGSCTGHAAEGALGSGDLLGPIPLTVAARPTGDEVADHEQAVALYAAATRLDEFAGEWPPEDTGSNGLSVAKACQRARLISGYRHAFGVEAALTALAERPVIAGITWWSSFDEPEPDGQARIVRGASIRGGHEVVLDELDRERERVWFTNSWGLGWGIGGRAWWSWETFARLLGDDGDVTVFVPLDQPAPAPEPEPEADSPLDDLLSLFQRWWAEVEIWWRRHNLP
ncbi:hypothetical protein [Actinomadura sp. GTD37]|uniref:hypothetical protein n=1 Tax=Actinomadura sp. GTD37 TaxID=1778030 RepID=UPI0035C129F6